MFTTKRFLVAAALTCCALAAQTPPPGYDKLQDIWIVKNVGPGQWAGGDITTTSGSSVPFDTTQVYNGLPSLHYVITGPSQWWWISMLAGPRTPRG